LKEVVKMMSNIPIDLTKVSKANIDKEILRVGIIAELDAVNLYEQLAAFTENNDIKKILLDIAKEEKTHVGEFQTLLLRLDKQQVDELKAGEEEVKEELGE
jgi:rubrerythrin